MTISLPDQVIELVKVMAEESGQSEADLVRQLLVPAVYNEASLRFKGINYLKHVHKKREAHGMEKPEP
jgi:hypothetical protein